MTLTLYLSNLSHGSSPELLYQYFKSSFIFLPVSPYLNRLGQGSSFNPLCEYFISLVIFTTLPLFESFESWFVLWNSISTLWLFGNFYIRTIWVLRLCSVLRPFLFFLCHEYFCQILVTTKFEIVIWKIYLQQVLKYFLSSKVKSEEITESINGENLNPVGIVEETVQSCGNVCCAYVENTWLLVLFNP